MMQRADAMEIIRVKGDSPPEVFEKMSAIDIACIGSEGWSAEAFFGEACQPDGIVLAAFMDEVMAGILVGFTASDTGEILSVATAPKFRRKGIARALMTEFFRLVPAETENIALEVRQSNVSAIKLYESFGFEKAGVRKRLYRDPLEDADVMVKKL